LLQLRLILMESIAATLFIETGTMVQDLFVTAAQKPNLFVTTGKL